MKVSDNKSAYLATAFAVAAFFIDCSQPSYQTILYNAEYIAINESSSLNVDASFGIIPSDAQGRPGKNFHMDLYEFPNHPNDENAGDSGFLPQINVNWYEARDICQSFGKRLCSVYEWRETCFSDGNGKRKTDSDTSWSYPYDGEYNTDICVTETSSAATVGSRSGCITSSLGFEISDMSGNVWEWVNHDFYGQGDEFQGQQAIVGGYYFSGGNAKCSATLILSTNTKNERKGFRCCSDAE